MTFFSPKYFESFDCSQAQNAEHFFFLVFVSYCKKNKDSSQPIKSLYKAKQITYFPCPSYFPEYC